MTTTLESRSSVSLSNAQELLDTGHTKDISLEQYVTPSSLSRELMAKLNLPYPATVFDPQVASGSLVNCLNGYPIKFGFELDQDKNPSGVNVVHCNCMKGFEIVEDLMPELRFKVANANPPFGRSWTLPNGKKMDSTLATWRFVTAHADCGFFIGNADTIERLELHRSTDQIEVTFWERRPANHYWRDVRDTLEIGVICWQAKETQPVTPYHLVNELWSQIRRILQEEKTSRPDYNIFLHPDGQLRTYLSVRSETKLHISQVQLIKLHTLNHCHPLTLVAEVETRRLLQEFIDSGVYTLQPEALAAIKDALAQVETLACPIMNVTDLECIAYADELDQLVCHSTAACLAFTPGKTYAMSTGTYKFTEQFTRTKLHFSEQNAESYTMLHECQLSGVDRYVQVFDDNGRPQRFMDRPRDKMPFEHPEKLLWEMFTKPVVQTVAEMNAPLVAQNHAVLKSCELMSNYRYYEGQLMYLARVATKDCGLIAAATGAGKTLCAISMIAMKAPDRTLIIAPQGTTRSSESEEDDEAGEMTASQWVQELNRFAPFLQVWEIFSYEDYQRILSLNGGKLPFGTFISYYEGMFSNRSLETAPQSWDDEKLNKWGAAHGLGALELQSDKHHWVDTIGKEVNGIRCILEPCLATRIGHEFDMVIVDECHKAANLESNLTQMLIRLQPKYRWGMTATPIPNIVSNLFSLMGWLSVPNWYQGNLRNAAWPYARHELPRFNATFLTMERDFTQEAVNRRKDPKNRGAVINPSPIISSPARLLKLLKPTMAYLSKEQTNPGHYIPPKVMDVRVPMGKEQANLYAHFLDRANIPATHPRIRAMKQVAYLRGVCTDPKGFRHHTTSSPKVVSNMNPKVVATLELVHDILARGETVIIINSRTGLSDTLQDKLIEAGIPLARIDSTITAEQHAYQANLFKQGKAKVLLMGLKSAAAYSFDDCCNLIIGSLEYTFGTFEQAKGRIDRVTNKTVKNIYCILCKNSIEEVQYEVVSLKGDAATICLKGERVPRDYKPVDPSEVMAAAFERFDLSGATPETKCEALWPKLQQRLAKVAA